MPPEVLRELQKRDIFLANLVQDADCGCPFAEEPDDVTARSSKLPLQRCCAFERSLKVLLKQPRKNVHTKAYYRSVVRGADQQSAPLTRLGRSELNQKL